MMNSVLERLWKHTIPEPMSGCWLWDGALSVAGYGRIGIAGKSAQQAHRVCYEIYKRPIPAGLDLDHLCRVRCCINPDHLEPVTRKENLRRGDNSYRGENMRAKTHCPKGHPYHHEKRMGGRGLQRICKPCRNEASNAYKARKKARRCPT